MKCKFALKSHFELFDLPTTELTHQQSESFGKLQMRLESLHDLGAQPRNVHGTAGGKPEKHITDLLRHIRGHILLSFLRGRTQMGGQHQTTLDRSQRRVLSEGF